MAGKEYKARDKTVNKMTRNGLIEENLRRGTRKRISSKEMEPPVRAAPSLLREVPEGDKEQIPQGKRRQSAKQQLKQKGAPEEFAILEAGEAKDEKGEIINPADKQQQLRKRFQKGEEESDQDEHLTETEEIQDHPMRMEGIRESSGYGNYIKGMEETRHNRKKKMVQSYARKKDAKKEAETLSDFKEEVEKKVKRERTIQEARKGRLSFDDESPMVKGTGINPVGKAAQGVSMAVSGTVHGQVHKEESDNASVEAAHKSELVAEQAARSLRNAQERRKKKSGYSGRLHDQKIRAEQKGRLNFGVSETEKNRGTGIGVEAIAADGTKKQQVRKFWQKKRYKDAYLAAKQGKKVQTETLKVTETLAVKAKKAVQEIFRRNRMVLLILGLMAMLILLVSSSLTSCSALVQGAGTTVVSTTYAADDSDIYAAENAYLAMEADLNEQINNMEATHPDYGEYQYQVDEISHNPYHLISYLTVKYGDFTYAQVADELVEIFREQYGIQTESRRETVTETRTVRVGESLGQVVTSGYCNCPICCGQWSGGPTASGAMPTPSHTIAVDAGNPFVPMGTKVIMNGVEYVVEDTGAFDRYGVQFDVYYGDHATASAHGHQTWEAYIADDNGSREVEVTSTREVNQLNVTLSNHSLDAVLRSRMNDEEEERYGYYNRTFGNRDYLFDVNTLPVYGGGFGYDIPADALSDERFAKMIHEAEKYLGYPYVWGGASPSTSFDCSGFVSWVINNCGNGWNVGRQTAEGLRSCCAQVSPSQAKPGDLVFFQGTYDTPGASHIGIYVGNGMMIHCGSPIQYTSIETAYWQQHLMAFGRLP